MLSLRNQVLRQEGVNSVPDKGGKGGYVSSPLSGRQEREYSTTKHTLQKSGVRKKYIPKF